MSVLSGMRVVEGSAFVAVPLAGMTLAQMGAEVIRFDRIGGGLDAGRWPLAPNGQSLFWAGMNKGKKSIAVDMKSSEGRELITEIITAPGPDAGLFLTNLRVRGWMDYETLRRHREDLVMVTLTGDRHGRPQVDYTVNPALGVPHMTGPEDHADPVAHALPAWDLIAGNMCVSALLAAERHRLRGHGGQEVELALKDVAAATLGHLGMIADASLNAQDRGKAGNALYGAYGQDFLCADGRRVMVIGLTHRQWRGLIAGTGLSDAMAALEARLGVSLDLEGHRWRHRAAITEVLAPWFAARRVADFEADFNARGLTWSEFRTVREAMAQDPDLTTDNPMFAQVSHPGVGTFLTPRHPATFSAQATCHPGSAPVLGAHTEEILAEVLGLPGGSIGRLFDKGIVEGPAPHATQTAA
ncbi:2-methylfumaryl-CoA isomerase [Jannaschia pagri]|uniref:2-methylfumaryl-CoA isomerase n=1 Tax=Jannaschia pagri TaxID=2829797 RepID=A0ABQ4NR71_9RHOB|nr:MULTISPECIES: CoA transferase [unclassified Jannaschia]GIT93074.1 2-methylfumaryl-CoA isomerase [Jannaschia sp. AI_61]GIT96909.1 2-methylfumaryl-CoA isomerase [Jannaschia sp. AI_62]